MTRFARAQGSKACNDKIPEEATPWQTMKQQLLDHQVTSEAAQNTNSKLNCALSKHSVDESSKNVTWATFENSLQIRNQSLNVSEEIENTVSSNKKKSKNKEKNKLKYKSEQVINTCDSDISETRKNSKHKKHKKRESIENELIVEEAVINMSTAESSEFVTNKRNKKSMSEENSESKIEVNCENLTKENKKKKKLKLTQSGFEKNNSQIWLENNIVDDKLRKKIKRKQKKTQNVNFDVDNTKAKTSENNNDSSVSGNLVIGSKKGKKRKHDNTDVADENVNIKKPKTKKKKKGKKIKSKDSEIGLVTEVTSDTVSSEVKNKLKKEKKLKKHKANSLNHVSKQYNQPNMFKNKFRRYFEDPSMIESMRTSDGTNLSNEIQFKKNKFRNNQQEPRELIINGVQVKLVKFQGFEIELEDAKRLEELQKKLWKENLSHEEVNNIIKLERRKAEKALSRKKKKVCLKCRGYGHLLSQCPELEEGCTSGQGTGICFKCGSTEHSHIDCRVVRGDQYRYATCFICGEEGHIARQCSSNTRGIYPKGGACRICGEVTHLMKDCPQQEDKKESKTVTVGTINNSNLESLEEDLHKKNVFNPSSVSHKRNTIKF